MYHAVIEGRPDDARGMTDEGKFVGSIVRSDLVALCQGGVVEDRFEEVVESTTQSEHRLPHMNQFRGPLPMQWQPNRRPSSRWKSVLNMPESSPSMEPREISL